MSGETCRDGYLRKLRMDVEHEVFIWTVREQASSHRQSWSIGGREVVTNRTPQNSFVGRMTVSVHAIRICFLLTVVILSKFESGNTENWEAVEPARLLALRFLHVEDRERTQAKVLGAYRLRP